MHNGSPQKTREERSVLEQPTDSPANHPPWAGAGELTPARPLQTAVDRISRGWSTRLMSDRPGVGVFDLAVAIIAEVGRWSFAVRRPDESTRSALLVPISPTHCVADPHTEDLEVPDEP